MFSRPSKKKLDEHLLNAGHGLALNNHDNLRIHRESAIKAALRNLRGPAGSAPPELIIVAGSALVHSWALDCGFVAIHTLRPIIEEQDPQRANRLARSGVPSCQCDFSSLSGGSVCSHHDFVHPVVLLVDCLPFLDPAEVEAAVQQLGSGNLVSVCMMEPGPEGVYDLLGTGECWQVVSKDVHYAYVCGNNSPYISPTLSSKYPEGATSVTFSFLVRDGISAVHSLGYHQDSRGFVPELHDHNAGYDLVHHGKNQFLAVSRIAVNQVIGVLLSPPSRKNDGPERYLQVAQTKVQSMLARATVWHLGAIGHTVQCGEVLVAGDYPDAHGLLVTHILDRCARRTSYVQALRSKLNAIRAHAARHLGAPAAAFVVLGAVVAYKARSKPAPPGAVTVLDYAYKAGQKALAYLRGVDSSSVGQWLDSATSSAQVVSTLPGVLEIREGLALTPEQRLAVWVDMQRNANGVREWLATNVTDETHQAFTGWPRAPGNPFTIRNLDILIAPLWEEWYPAVSILITAGHIFNRGFSGHCPTVWSAIETIARVILCLTSGHDSYWVRVVLHAIRNIEFLVGQRAPPGSMPGLAVIAVAIYYLWRRYKPKIVGLWRKIRAARAGKLKLPAWIPQWAHRFILPSGTVVNEPRTRDAYAAQVDLLLNGVPFGPHVVASPGSSVPEYHTEVELVDRPGWKVQFDSPAGGVYRRTVPIEDSSVGIAAMTFENGLTPRTAISSHPYDYRAMAAGRILNIQQRPGVDRSMRLQWAADFFTRHFAAVAEARAAIYPFNLEPMGSPAFDEVAMEFIEHFKVPSIQKKWMSFLEEMRNNEFVFDPDEIPKYSIFLKMEAWWKLSSKSDGYLGKAHVGHKPRAIWVPDEKQILMSAIMVYHLAKRFKATTAYQPNVPNMNIVYTSSMSGDEVGRRVNDFLDSTFDLEDGSTWFILLVNGDDNWWVFHPKLTDAHPEVEDCMLQWQTTMREVGRNTEAQARPLYASSYSSARFLPAMTRGNDGILEETLILTPCWARMSAKLSASLSQLPLRKNGSTDLPTEDGYKMWLRRVSLSARDFARGFSHDPVGYDLMSAIASHVESLLDGQVSGPTLDRTKREVMADEYQHNVNGTYLPHREYEEAISMWFGCSYDDVVNGAASIRAAWEQLKWEGPAGRRYLTSGHMDSAACYLIMRGLGETPPTMLGKASKDFYSSTAIQEAQEGGLSGKKLSEVNPDEDIQEDLNLQAAHLAAHIAWRVSQSRCVLFVGREWADTPLVWYLLRAGVRRDVRYDFWPKGNKMRTVNGFECKVNNLSTEEISASTEVIVLADLPPPLPCERVEQIYITEDIRPTMSLLPWKGRREPVEFGDNAGAFLLLGTGANTQVHVACYRRDPADELGHPAEPGADDDESDTDYSDSETSEEGDDSTLQPRFFVNGPVDSPGNEGDLLESLGYFADIGVAATLCNHTWVVPFLPQANRQSKYHVIARESDAAAFDNSTTEESVDTLVGVLKWMGNFQGPQVNLLNYLQRSCRFTSKHMTGTAAVCWPSGIPPTSFGGSCMNGMEVVECMRRCFLTRGIAMPLPKATASWSPPSTARMAPAGPHRV